MKDVIAVEVVYVETDEKAKEALEVLSMEPELAVDIEGENLGHDGGCISLIQITANKFQKHGDGRNRVDS